MTARLRLIAHVNGPEVREVVNFNDVYGLDTDYWGVVLPGGITGMCGYGRGCLDPVTANEISIALGVSYELNDFKAGTVYLPLEVIPAKRTAKGGRR